ncbi:hypothetical protein D9758_005603 [Tetrapyrgos nigripes]|uniref:N-acetyltransferase domain-containing protein n=1 Tax=Tetrapyrgos nigripes TaxID=182062 RepID=A0A8H5GGJ1_9AGAR|nr:hypothetical protein D9758_005603 [Tetrapyrgos nigripes]
MASNDAKAPYIRLAKKDDFEDLAIMLQKAFIRSPPQSFYARLDKPLTTDPEDASKRKNQFNYLRYLLHRCWAMQARITILVVPTEGHKEIIAGVTIWLPPGVRRPPSLFKSLILPGLVPLLLSWGVGFRKRVYELVSSTESVLKEAYASKKLPGSPADSWYLLLAGTDPEYQGKGYMSKLIRETIEQTGDNAIFTLEANNPKARDVYVKHGFEVVGEVRIGKGSVDDTGILAQGEKAVGFPMYPMIRHGQ